MQKYAWSNNISVPLDILTSPSQCVFDTMVESKSGIYRGKGIITPFSPFSNADHSKVKYQTKTSNEY